MQFITKDEAFEEFGISCRQTLYRYVKKYKIRTQSQGKTQATYYNKKDIQKISSYKKKHKEEKKKLYQIITKKKRNILNKEGKQEYLRVKKELIKNKTYNKMDRAILIAFSVSYQTMLYSQREGSKINFVFKNHLGQLKVHPLLTILNTSMNQLNKCASLLGIGARNRNNLKIS